MSRYTSSFKYWTAVAEQNKKKAAEVALAEDAGDPSSANGASADHDVSRPLASPGLSPAPDAPPPEREEAPALTDASSTTTPEKEAHMDTTHPVYVTSQTKPRVEDTTEPGILQATVGTATFYGSTANLRRVVNELRSLIAAADRQAA